MKKCNQQPKSENVKNNKNVNNAFVSTFENLAYDAIGPKIVVKAYYMLKINEKEGNKKPIHIITRSPNQLPIYKTSDEIKPID